MVLWYLWQLLWALSFVSQVNGLHVADPVEALLQLQDCSVFIKIIGSMWVCTTSLSGLSSKAVCWAGGCHLLPCLGDFCDQKAWTVLGWHKPVWDPEARTHWPRLPVTMVLCGRSFTLVPPKASSLLRGRTSKSLCSHSIPRTCSGAPSLISIGVFCTVFLWLTLMSQAFFASCRAKKKGEALVLKRNKKHLKISSLTC